MLRQLLAWLNPIALRGGEELPVLVTVSRGAGSTLLRGTVRGATYDPMRQAVVIELHEEL